MVQIYVNPESDFPKFQGNDDVSWGGLTILEPKMMGEKFCFS